MQRKKEKITKEKCKNGGYVVQLLGTLPRQILFWPVLWFFYNSGKPKLPPSFQTVPPPNTSPLLECLHTEDPICIKLGIERRGEAPCINIQVFSHNHRKKRFASFPSPAGMSLPNSPWAGIMTS
jgi:hypothetical protein